jgi:serine/threonine-protein kinase
MPPSVTKALRVLAVLAYAGLVAVLFLLTAYLSFNLFVRSGTTAAPDLAGLSAQEATGLLSDTGLALRVAEDAGRFDAEVPADHVLAQEPGARTLVKRGSTVTVTLSLGPQRLSVPELAGRSLQSAQVSLAASGLALGRVLNVLRQGAEPGTVIGQAPAAGSPEAPATPVDVLVALPGSVPAYVMPDLVARDYERVRSFFEARGFRFGSVKFETYEGAREGMILRQFPLAGHPVAPGDPISLVVATDAGTAVAG